jgi:hypothetical protein
MKHRVQCPQCNTWLRGGDFAVGTVLTCPRCLAEVTLPAEVAPATAIQAQQPEAKQVAPPQPQPLSALQPSGQPHTCPWCREPVQPHWRACPMCRAVLGDRQAKGPTPKSLDVEVKQDRTAAGFGMIVLAFLGCVGYWSVLQVYFSSSASRHTNEKTALTAALCFTFLGGLVLLGAAWSAYVGSRWAGQNTRSLASGFVQVIGILVTIGMVGLAGLMFLGFACAVVMSGGMR